MSQQARFGEFLGRLVTLSRHDVDEILEEQGASRHRFGEIALSRGLCAPEDVWQAWCDQLLTQVQKVDLDQLGIDSQAASLIDPETARRLGAIPIRLLGNHLIVAVSDAHTEFVANELSRNTRRALRFVVADHAQLQRAMSRYYPAPNAAA